MRKMLILGILLVFSLLFIGVFQLFAGTSPHEQLINKTKEVDKTKLFKYTIDFDPEQTKLLAEEQYKVFPPLRPERFQRRIKMLWGIDVNDYPEDTKIWFGLIDYRISIKYQTISGFYQFHPDEAYELAPPPQKVYNEFRNYLLYNDKDAYSKLEEWRNSLDSDELYYYDVLTIMYNSVIFTPLQLMNYIDQYVNSDFCHLNNFIQNIDIPTRVFDMKTDLLRLYIQKQVNNGRDIVADSHIKNGLWLGFDLNKTFDLSIPEISTPYAIHQSKSNDSFKINPWRVNTRDRGVAANLSYMLQFNNKQINKTILKYMSGQLDYDGGDGIYIFYKPRHEKIRSDIKFNNYYGYSILREFCENPMREMPTLEKIGTNFKAQVNKSNSLLLLEPFADSYDIDTIQPNETFKAYEMGHDDYYLIEIEKPVESPVAGKDGYAMILDRKETVYGYLPKSIVKKFTSQEVLSETQHTDKTKSKQGVIADKDGYVNIRKEANTQSEVVGKILNKEKFKYWETSDNWSIVETSSGIRGYVYKDRIREKYDTGGWTIDE